MNISELVQKIRLDPEKLKIDYNIGALYNAYSGGTDCLFDYAKTLTESERFPMMLQFCLERAVNVYEEYQKHGIDKQIYLDTMKDITIWVGNCERDTGIYGMSEYSWIINHIEFRLFRLGRLQFEVYASPLDAVLNGRIFPKGSTVLNVHVPQGEPLLYEDCRKSYDMAVEFFGINRFCCESWLLSPMLKKVLPPSANIIRFQSDYSIISVCESRQCEERIFLRLEDNAENYNAVTKLQKSVKELLLSGESIGGGTGMFNIKADNGFSVSGQRQYELMQRMDYVRVVGTEGEEMGANALLSELSSFGISGHTEEFEFIGYEVIEARLEILAPYKKEYTVTGYGLSGTECIEAPFYYAENGDDGNMPFVKGKIAMINGALSAAVYKKLLKAGAVGFVTISGTPLDTPEQSDLETRALRPTRHLSGNAKKIPGVTIRYNDAVEIVEQEACTARITITQQEKTLKGKNVIADIQGSGDSDEIIVFMAHYDSVPFSPGAYDNSSGAAIIMEMCRYFKANPPTRSVRFTWFSGEEIGLVGSLEYVKQHEHEMPNIVLGVNVDLAGHTIGDHSISVTGDMSILSSLEYLGREYGFPLRFAQEVCSSDSTSFSDVGIPTLSLRRGGYGGHNRHDTLSLISAKSLQKTADLLCLLGNRIANSPVFPFNREMPQNMREGLDRYFGRD